MYLEVFLVWFDYKVKYSKIVNDEKLAEGDFVLGIDFFEFERICSGVF